MELIRSGVLAAFILLVATPFTASAGVSKEDCATVDYSPKLGLNRQQRGTEWCWAMVASDLIGFHQGIAPRNQVSPIDVALQTMTMSEAGMRQAAAASGDFGTYRMISNEASDITDRAAKNRGLRLAKRKGWSLFGAIGFNSRGGACLESELPSRAATPFRDNAALAARPGPLKDQSSLSFVEEELKRLGDDSTAISSVPAWARVLSTCRKEGESPLNGGYSTLFEEYNQLVLSQVAESARARCRGSNVRPMSGEVQDFSRGASSDAPLKLSGWLKAGAPVAISFPSGYARSGVAGWHEAVLAGMRWNNKTNACEFKIRDSFGSGCGQYRSEVAAKCEGGNFWMSEDDLKSQVRFASRLTSPRP